MALNKELQISYHEKSQVIIARLRHGNKRKCNIRRKCSQALRRLCERDSRHVHQVMFNNANKSLRACFARAQRSTQYNSHWLCLARCSFHPEKAEVGEKVGEKIIERLPRVISFVNPREGKHRPVVLPDRPISDLPQWFIYALAVDQTIYDSNDPGRNNWNGNERKLCTTWGTAHLFERCIKCLTRRRITQNVCPFKPVA